MSPCMSSARNGPAWYLPALKQPWQLFMDKRQTLFGERCRVVQRDKMTCICTDVPLLAQSHGQKPYTQARKLRVRNEKTIDRSRFTKLSCVGRISDLREKYHPCQSSSVRDSHSSGVALLPRCRAASFFRNVTSVEPVQVFERAEHRDQSKLFFVKTVFGRTI